MCRPLPARGSQGENPFSLHTMAMRRIPALLLLLSPIQAFAAGLGRATAAPRIKLGPSSFSLSAPLTVNAPSLSPLIPVFAPVPGTEAPAPSPDAKPKLIETLSAEAPDLDRLPASGASAAVEADFNSRAQLGPSRTAVPAETGALETDFLPALISDELDRAAERLLGSPLPAAQKAAVLAETSVKRIRWFHHFTNDILPVPDGVTYEDSRISLSLRSGWKKYPSVEDHFRVLMTHEYVHRLQNEGVYTRAFGVEIPAVTAELLRAIELAGLDRLKAGHINFIGEGVLGSFENGRSWARGGRTSRDGFYSKGFMAGAAYELAQMTGRPEDAWKFLRKAASGKNKETLKMIFETILMAPDSAESGA